MAVIFGLGASLAAWTRVETSYDVFTVILFACLCWINCAASRNGNRRFRARPLADRSSGCVHRSGSHRHCCIPQRPVLAGAESASAVAFVLLDRGRVKLSADALRVLADAALLSPILFLPLAGLRA